MPNAQEWLDKKYSKETRENVKELNVSNEDLEGKLDLGDFINLKELDCSKNKLIGLDVNNCSKLIELKCFGNQLGEIDLRNNKVLVEFSCQNNRLTTLDLSNCRSLEILKADNWEESYGSFNELSDISFLGQLPNPEKLKVLHLHANNIHSHSDLNSDLAPFSRFTNLEELDLGLNGFSKEFTAKRGNKFHGSLEPLKNLSKLKNLDIGNTDIDSGLEHLSDSVRRLSCSVKERPESAVDKIRKQLAPCNYDIKIWREWRKRGVNSSGIAQLTEAGVKVNDYDFADYLKTINYEISRNSNIEELEEKYEKYCQLGTWLCFQYPVNKREGVTELNINKKNLKGNLVIKGWKKLEILDCSKYGDNEGSYFPKITLDNLPELKIFIAKNCGLSDLSIIDCPQLRKIDINKNPFVDLNFLRNLNSKELSNLDVYVTDINYDELEKHLSDLPDNINLFPNGIKMARTKEVKEWLSRNYAKEKRSKVKELGINNKFLKGELDLRDFVNLEKLDCSNNELTNLNLSNNNKLKEINCSDNLLVTIDLPNYCTEIKYLNLTNNNFPKQNLSFLTQLTSLKRLYLGNADEESISQSIYNRFTGSLKFLKNLSKLEILDISNTDIDCGWEYLSDSLKAFEFSCDERPGAKVNSFEEDLKCYGIKNIRKAKAVYWTKFGPEFEEKVSALWTKNKALGESLGKIKKSLYKVREEGKEEIFQSQFGESYQVISGVLESYISSKKEELESLLYRAKDRLEEKDLLGLLDKLGEFKRIRENFLQKELTNEERKEFYLIKEELKQLKAIEEIEEKEENDLIIEKETRENELEKLLIDVRRGLSEELLDLLEVLLEFQVNAISSIDGSRIKERLEKLKSSLGRKMDKKKLEEICQKQKEIAQLEKIIQILKVSQKQEFQSQVQISPK